ncbi:MULTISPECIES: cytochrome P450 [Streptomyces]|uniref:Cytochrome P450 126 n=1 Tax=Streptomyces canarius TaxID=285453 RepID=A0ABQ3D1E9_9ACTN|nr:cytochrome P450 [Streptomyces canarius]GHA46494.1 putative cytochrome P450 126 [Streptomyces canarius]
MTSLPLASPDELDELDFADPRLHAEHDLTEVWRRLRAERPFHRQPARGSRPGFWVITRYADVVEVYRSREFTTEHGNSLPTLLTGGDAAAGTLLAVTDGLRHQRIRAILTRAFSPRVLAAVQEGVRRTADELVAAAVAKGEADFVRDVAANIPLGAVFDLLGVARGDRQYLLGLVSRAGRSRHADAPPEDSWTAESEILLYFADLARTRRGGDGDDVVSLLANCRVDGEPLSDAELMADCYGLLTGGDETGRHAISGGLLALIGNPEQWDALRSGALDLRVAADEVLRWTVPSLHGGRTATADVEVNGRPIRAGEIVSAWIASANRDGDVFPDADRFDLTRTPNRHLAFASGAHHCLGHVLARAGIEAVLDSLRRMVSGVRQTAPETWIHSSILHGMNTLPVTLEADPAGLPP